MIQLVVLAAVLGMGFAFIKTQWLRGAIKARCNLDLHEPQLFSVCVLIVFLLFTGLGLTGSSLNLGLGQTPFVESNMKRIWGHEQPVRSDEWLVLTPMSIAQYNHEPPFPVTNSHLGPEGQNMLIVGMTGLPVAHLSTLAKPATWGFFLFDLKRALAWYWWFPVFGCFLALAHLLNGLLPGYWRQSFLFALLFVTAPYVVAWSFWPAYAVFFPCVALLCLLKIVRLRRTWTLLPLGVLAGLSLAGFVLLLYPPWQVSVGYVFLAALIGIAIRDRLYKTIGLESALTVLLALLVAGILIGSWWLSARDAVDAMMHTVYPGQRNIEVGGDVAWASLFKGYTNLTTLTYLENRLVNQSEAASFQYYFLPLAVLFVLRARRRTLSALEMALLAVTGFILVYMLVGVGRTFSTYSLWSHVTAKRADLALGLVSLMLAHLLMRPEVPNVAGREGESFLVWIVSMIWAAVVYDAIRSLDGLLMAGLSPSILLGMMLIVIASGYFLLNRQPNAFLGLNLGLSLAATLSFHPVSVAPGFVRMSPTEQPLPILTLGSQIPAMFLAASGQPVINGVFYYPQTGLWSRLDPEGHQVQLYNRYQHLIFRGEPTVEAIKITVPQADVVTVLINLQYMDFARTGAGLLLASDSDSALLRQNRTLVPLRSENGWSWFRVGPRPVAD